MQIGAQFMISAHPYEVAHVGENALRLCPTMGGNQRRIEYSALSSLLETGEIEVIYTPPAIEAGLRSGLTPRQTDALNRKLSYVKGIYKQET